MLLQFADIEKSFATNHVLRGINFTAASGRAFGLLGRNGAGKTTTIRLLMNVFAPDKGRILLDGAPLDYAKLRLGYLPEEKGLYPKEKILRQMMYIGELRGLSRREAKHSALTWLDRLQMSEHSNRKLDTLSKGNQQKIQLAVALITNPDLVILDEPFSGLDPVNALLLKDVVREQVAQGKIVFFSSHQMSYVESFCDDIAILQQGRIVLGGDLKEIKQSYPKDRIAVRLADKQGLLSPPAVLQTLKALYDQRLLRADLADLQVTADGALICLSREQDRAMLLEDLLRQGLDLESFAVQEPSLEDLFVKLTRHDNLGIEAELTAETKATAAQEEGQEDE